MTVIESGEYLSGALAEADSESLAPADAFEVEHVAVEEEGPLLAIGELDRFLGVPGEFEERAEAALLSAGYGAGAKEVSHVHVAPGDCVVRQLLVRTPVHVLEVALRNKGCLAHRRRLQRHVQLHIVRIVVRVS